MVTPGKSRASCLGVSVATWGDIREQPRVADGASQLLEEVFGKTKTQPA